MLMRWLTSLPKVNDEHRLVVFLAPTVALVDQQAGVICRHTPLRVATYTGDTGARQHCATAVLRG